MLPLRRQSRGSAGFLGVRMRPSGRFAADISHDGVRWWLSTFDSADEAARAYGAVAWRFGRLRRDLNFPDVQSLQETEFLAPEMQWVNRDARRQQRDATMQCQAAELDDMRMSQLRLNHPEYVQAELAFYASAAKKKKSSDGAGPSNTAPPPPVPVDDSSSLGSDFWDKIDDSDVDWE